MANVVCVRLNWDNTAMDLRAARHFFNLHVDPEPGYPFGRKGFILASAWKQLAGKDAHGMLILDGDVAIDPEDHRLMLKAIHDNPGIVHVGAARLWPVSTKKDGWSWAHWISGPTQVNEPNPVWFSFCYTYLPKALIDGALKAGLRGWAYPSVDRNVAETCMKMGIDVRVVPGCAPKHLNY